MTYKNWNQYLGWLVFLIATAVYFITIEDTVSLWDCGEYITAAYKLEVGHPPGAPLFMILGRLFSFFADPTEVAGWINRLSAISSSLTILFMFWSLTMLVKKMVLRDKKEMSQGDQIAIFGSAIIGSLAYTFSDSFWFSAVEGEVYAMSSLFTAAIFWAILKWDEEMAEVKNGRLSTEYLPNRWLLLIMFLLGLAIGVHLLGILVVPAISFIIYFRYVEKTTMKGIILTGILSIAVLGFIQEGVIPGSIALASAFEVTFRNSLGLPFNTGAIFFLILLVAVCIWMLKFAARKGNAILYNATMGLILVMIGFGSFAVIVIRSNANKPLDENDPENLVTLHAYLKREQYGYTPLLTGPHWNSQENDGELWDSRSPFYLRRYVVIQGDREVKAFKSEKAANEFVAKNGGIIEEKYFESNAEDRLNSVKTYSQTTIFPRMYWDQEQERIDGYIKWSGYDAEDGTSTEIGRDGKRLPTFGENLTYFMRYQVDWMYWRYFMWNFAGRQNDIQGHGDNMRGNWVSGYSMIDHARLGEQGENAPFFTSQNPTNNKFFLLPLVLGVIGLFFHFYRAPKDAFVLFLAFLFTGVAIVVYLNQKPFEPRERDYAFAGSFYFFAMWIGIGVYALYEAFLRFTKDDFKKVMIAFGAGLLFFATLDLGSDVSMPITMTWIMTAGVGAAAIGLMMLLRRTMDSATNGAVIATLLGLFVPLIMGMQGWDDHDRSLKTSAHDLAFNYLESCSENGILFTNGDNDTFPLWYMQEVEGVRTDVRVCNLSLMQTDWYTEQMMMRAYKSAPLPIKFREDQILMSAGFTDQVLFTNLIELFYINASEKQIKEVIKMRSKHNAPQVAQAITTLEAQMSPILMSMGVTETKFAERVEKLKISLTTRTGKNTVDNIYAKYQAAMEIMSALQNKVVTLGEAETKQFQEILFGFEESWDFADIDDIMAYVRNDDNIVLFNERQIRVFPSTGFILPVNAENAVKSGLITKAEKQMCLKEIRFKMDARALTREQVMMLDVIANNDWKRGIFFSSPGNPSTCPVPYTLYRQGFVKQNGMAFELSPLSDKMNRYNEDKMYKNLMETYHYGAMSNPDVITDYYTRRHTVQFRLHFASLANYYLEKVEMEQREASNINLYRKAGRVKEADSLVKLFELKYNGPISKLTQRAEGYRSRARKLISRSLEVMPAEIVIDYGEPQETREEYRNGGLKFNAWSDGILHEYVTILLRAGDSKGAEKLATVIAGQLESIFMYFEMSDVHFSSNPENTGDLYAALDAYFKLYMSCSDPDFGNKYSAISKRLFAKINSLYKTSFPSIYDRLKELANENGESTSPGSQQGMYAARLSKMKDFIEAAGVHFGFLKPSGPPVLDNGQQGLDAEMEEILRQQQMVDTAKP
ncbi:MAG: DUF2723 domain-containing protein [Flavobacteriia bacterium]